MMIPLYYSLVFIIFLFLGISIKLIDVFYNPKLNQKQLILLSIICGLLIGILISIDYYLAPLLLGIVFAVAITKKIDNFAFRLGTLIIFLILIIVYLNERIAFNFPLLLIFTIAGAIDEIGNDLADCKKLSGFLKWFFDYRFLLKVTVIAVFLLGMFPLPYVLDFFAFDLSYILFELIYDKKLKLSVF